VLVTRRGMGVTSQMRLCGTDPFMFGCLAMPGQFNRRSLLPGFSPNRSASAGSV
jgi:hypothetical protein